VKAASDLQTYVGADNEKKYKYQKQVNKLIDKQGDLEKKIRNTESDLTDTKSAVAKQQLGIDQLARSMEATKGRGG
jgi:chromosome segregation ATPase